MKYNPPPLTSEQIKEIQDVLRDLDRGAPTFSHEEVFKKLREKYGKK